MANAFIPNDDISKTDINHKDENKENNNVNNLEWCTKKYNNNFGTHYEKVSKTQRNRKDLSKKINQYDLTGKLIKTWESSKEIQRQLGYSFGNICACCRGIIKTSNGFLWRYA